MAAQYARLKIPPQNQNFEVWLQEWERVYNTGRTSLISVSGKRRHFLLSSSWSKYTETTVVGSMFRRIITHKDPLQLPLRTSH
jgi:hypothetical protein